MIDISKKLNRPKFPLDVFGADVKDSMLHVANQYNIPVDYMGTMALFTLGALSGGMYVGNANGGIKTMIYAMLIGPSGVGKTPAYRLLCSNIIKEQFKKSYDEYRELLHQWKILEKAAAKSGAQFDQRKPILAVRMMTDGTPEGMIKKMDRSPCGFGVYYDEAAKIYNLTKYRSGPSTATEFWNELWNGDPYYDVKADDDREMYVHNPCISLCIGVQPDALDKIITIESINKGLSSRMLFCESDYIKLNESIDVFGPKIEMCNQWQEVISGLHLKGLRNFFKDDTPYICNFDSFAQKLFSKKVADLLKRSNQLIIESKVADITRVIVSYNSKLSQYFSRFCLLMAIFTDPTGPVIRVQHVEAAEALYNYYFRTAELVLARSFSQIQNNLNDSEIKLLDSLPDEFTSKQAADACNALGISEKYFLVASKRNLKDRIRRISRGLYEKL